MIIVGCSSVTEGSPTVDAADAPVYKASVSASIAESAASSSARESERQESLTQEAVHSSCETLSTSSVDAINGVNDYVDALNQSAADADAKAGPAVDGAQPQRRPGGPQRVRSADAGVEGRDECLGRRREGLATAIAGNYGPDEFNAAVTRLNDSKTTALNLCDASY